MTIFQYVNKKTNKKVISQDPFEHDKGKKGKKIMGCVPNAADKPVVEQNVPRRHGEPTLKPEVGHM